MAKILRSADTCEARYARDHYIIGTAGAVDDQEVAAGVPSADDADVRISRIKNEVARECVIPRNVRAISMLAGGSAAMPYDIGAVGLIVEHPIDK